MFFVTILLNEVVSWMRPDRDFEPWAVLYIG